MMKKKEEKSKNIKDQQEEEDEKANEEDEDLEREEEKEEEVKEKKEIEKKIIKFKVDGQEFEEEVTEQDLINNYSGRKAIQKRFLEIDKSRKELEKKHQEYEEDFNFIKEEMSNVRSSFDKVISDFTKTGEFSGKPLDGVFDLLDKMGLDSKEFDKAIFSYYIPEAARFLELDEVGRDAYLVKMENEWYKKGKQKTDDERKQANEYRSKLEKENSSIVKAGLTTESFNELKTELEENFNLKNLTTDQVIQWAGEKPFYERAEKISEKIPNVNIVEIAKLLIEHREITDEWLLDELGYKEILQNKMKEEFKNKLPKTYKQNKKSEESELDFELFKKIRGR